MGPSDLAPLSDAQKEIMDLVWQRGELAVSEVWEILAQRREVARNTVQTTLARMEEKGWLKHRVVGRTFFYSATQPQAAVRKRAVLNLLESLFFGCANEMAVALLESASLSREEADQIRVLIDEAERRRKRRKP